MKLTENTKKQTTNKSGIVLLSSGLDSLVALAYSVKEMDVILALTFDYGQKALEDEIRASKIISKKYNIAHKTIKLPFLKNITDNALTNPNKSLEIETFGADSMEQVWVPNRNGLFLNIGACFAESLNADYIIFGANKEEGEAFIDNSLNFIEKAGDFFNFSTLKKPKIFAPLKNMLKPEIINLGVKLGVDFSLVKSCYNSSDKQGKKHCGVCESCKRLYRAIIESDNKDLINLIF